MSYQGIGKLLLLTLFLLPTIIWLNNTGNPLLYFSDQVPVGQGFYVWAKLFGLYAVLLFWLQALLGLLQNTPYQPAWLTRKAHMYLGLGLLVAIMAHIASFITATTMRSGHLTWHFMLPDIDDFYHARITVGLLAFVLVLVVFVARRVRSHSVRLLLHRLSLPAFYLSAWHSLAIGTESRHPALITLYAVMLVSLTLVLLLRGYQSVVAPKMVTT